MKNFKRVIVVPVYNEAGSVKKVIESILVHKNADTKLILVQDGSDDGTEKILLQLSGYFAENSIDLVNHSQNQGYGKALISGFKKALDYENAEYILTMDCDEQHQPEDIGKFFAFRGVDILSGSRYLMDIEKGIQAPPDRVQINKKLTEKYIRIAQNTFHENWNLTDTFCGMKRYQRFFLESFMDAVSNAGLNASCLGYAFPLILWNYYIFWLKQNHRHLAESFAEMAIPKIYVSDDRTFGAHLDFPAKRYRYYLNCMKVTF